MEEEVIVEETMIVKNGKSHFPTLERIGYDLIAAVLSLVVILLPGIARYLATSEQQQSASLLFSSGFQLLTILVSLALSIYAIVKSETGSGTRVIALVALVSCVMRLVLVI